MSDPVKLPKEEAIRRLEEIVKDPKAIDDPILGVVDATLLDMVRDDVIEVADHDGTLIFRLKED
jgi:hypothetical protein